MANIERRLDFEGVGDLQRVRGFYAAQGITFSDNAVGLVDSDAGGSGNFGGESSANTLIAYAEDNFITMNLNFPDEITSGEISFFYTSPRKTHEVRILDAAGQVLKTEILSKTPSFGKPDPRGEFSPLIQRTIAFTGNARTIQFGSEKYELGIDDIEFRLVTATPANNRPTDIGLSNTQIAENSPNGTVIGAFNTTDPDAGDTHAYTLLDNPGGRFAIANNQLTVANGSFLDFEATPNYSIRIRTTDSAGNSFEETFTINLIDVNENPPTPTVNNAPTDIALSPATVAENSPANTVIGNLSATDPDVGDAQTFTLLDNAGGRFSIANNQVTVANGALLDFETNPTHTVRIRTTDSAGNTFEKALTIAVNNLIETSTDIALSAAIVPENSLLGTVIGILSATTPDAGASQLFTLLDDAGGRFSIVNNQLIVNDRALLNFEANQNHTVTVRATTATGQTFDKTFTITVNNVNEAPTDIILSAATVAENSPLGTVVGDLSATDPDVGDAQTFTLVDDAGGRFTLANNQVTVANGNLLDFEAIQNHSITVRATDAEGLTFDKTFTINVTDIAEITNQPPVAVDDTITSSTTGIVGSAGDDSISYSLSAPFTIQATDLLGNDSDPDNDPINLISVNNTANGNGTVAFSGTITFTPNLNAIGQGSFEYTLSDSNGNTDTGNVTVNVPAIQTIDGSTGNDYLTFELNGAENRAIVDLRNTADQTSTDGIIVTGFENVSGSIANDSLTGDGNANVIRGMDGNDLIAGFDGNDILDGGNGDDLIIGGADNDILDGGNGDDLIWGDNGNDNVSGGAGNDTIYQGYGADTMTGGDGDDLITGGASTATSSPLDPILGGSVPTGGNYLYGNQGNDTLLGGGSKDSMYAGEGNDSVVAAEGSSSNVLSGDLGADTIVGGGANDTLYGDIGPATTANDNDSIVSGANAQGVVMYGNQGNDTLILTAVEDTTITTTAATLYGGQGNDSVTSSDTVGGNTLYGDAGNDTLVTVATTDTLYGGAGDDSFDGVAGTATLPGTTIFGEDGSDTLVGKGYMYLDGGEGNDSLTTETGTDTVWGGAGNDILRAGTQAAGLDGGDGDDALYGSNLNDILIGGAGDDVIEAVSGGDIISGGAGNDTLYSGFGGDTITCGDGADRIYYDSKDDGSYFVGITEFITDFVSGTDKIYLRATAFTGLINANFPGAVAFAQVSANTGTTPVIVFDPTSKTVYYDTTGGTNGINDANALFTLSSGSIAGSDFVLF